jgi:hypothetical protein
MTTPTEDTTMIIVMNEQTYYSASELKRMGRTERQIRALGEPDATAPNPYGWSAPMKLYAEARVHADDSAKAIA